MEKSGGELRRIASHFTLTPQGLRSGVIVSVNSCGEIVSVESSSSIDSTHGVEFYSGVLIPGMVNCHSHLELSHMGGITEPQCGFARFAEAMGANRDLFTDQQRVDAMEFRDAVMWQEGVQAVADISNGALSLDVKRGSKIKYQTFFELFGLNTNSVNHIVKLMELDPSAAATLHSTYSLNRDMFEKGAQLTPNKPLSIHFMESQGEQELYHAKGELSEWYDKMGFEIDFVDYGSPVARIIETISSDREVMLVHNTFISERELDLLIDHFGDNVTFVISPRSNMHITGQLPPLELLRQKKVRVAVGTDSMASNSSISMVEEMKLLSGIPLEELLIWATLNGAKALGMDGEMGSIEVGKRCGLVVVDGVDWDKRVLTKGASARRVV